MKDPIASMAKYLDALIAANPDGVAQVQLQMMPGMQVAAGGLKHATMPDGSSARGLYELLTVAQPGPGAPAGTPEFIAIKQVFAASAVQAVSVQAALPEEMQPSGLVIPRGAGKLTGPLGGH